MGSRGCPSVFSDGIDEAEEGSRRGRGEVDVFCDVVSC